MGYCSHNAVSEPLDDHGEPLRKWSYIIMNFIDLPDMIFFHNFPSIDFLFFLLLLHNHFMDFPPNPLFLSSTILFCFSVFGVIVSAYINF